MRNTHATALHSWSSQHFTKISVAIFWISGFTHSPDGCKVCGALRLLGWKLAQADTVRL